jgi:hypothetical protein
VPREADGLNRPSKQNSAISASRSDEIDTVADGKAASMPHRGHRAVTPFAATVAEGSAGGSSIHSVISLGEKIAPQWKQSARSAR